MPREKRERQRLVLPLEPDASRAALACCTLMIRRSTPAQSTVESQRFATRRAASGSTAAREGSPVVRARRDCARHAEDLERPTARPHEAQQHLERRRLARPVGAEQSVDRALATPERDIDDSSACCLPTRLRSSCARVRSASAGDAGRAHVRHRSLPEHLLGLRFACEEVRGVRSRTSGTRPCRSARSRCSRYRRVPRLP